MVFTLAVPQKEADGGRKRGQRETAKRQGEEKRKSHHLVSQQAAISVFSALIYASVWLQNPHLNYRQVARGINRQA